jgi:CheY-like chemotaxis protein/anti-sigma regulatory factor (Ser/Thr protein kinase)
VAIESAIQLASNEIRHRARVVRDFGNATLRCLANERRLTRVFLNLIVNAAQAIPEGDATTNVIGIVTRAAGDRIVVEITDSGPGIPPAIRAHIFEPFFTTKPVGVGTGLGLAICHGIVTDLGGTIEVESKSGCGALFRVILPAASSPEQVVAAAPSPPTTTTRRARVLVVDDDVKVASAFRRGLARDYDVVTATLAREALSSLVAGESFDVILCDVMMPDVAGMDLYEEILRCVPHVAPRIVFMTGGAFTPRAKQFMKSVPNLRLEKPCDLATVRAIVRKVIDQEGPA